MAIKTKAQIQVESNVTYIDNTVGSITPANVRSFNTNWIDSTIYVEQTGSMTVASASVADSVVSASYALTASFLQGTIASASYAINSTNAATASFLLGAVSSASLAANSLLLQGTGSNGFVATGSFNTTSGSLSTRVTSLESFSSSLDATFATDAELNAATQSLSASTSTVNTRVTEVSSSLLQVSSSTQQVSASYIALSASYNTSSGSTSATLTAVSSSNQQLSASYIALSGSYNVFSGSASTRITNTEVTASNLVAASASFSTRVSDNTSNIQTLTSATASYAVLANNQTFTGTNTFNNAVTMSNVRVTGTASIAFLDVTFQSSSIIYSSGSNQFGDASNDTQTLFGTVNVITGPLVVTGSANFASVITGSITTALNANTATSSSFATTAATASSLTALNQTVTITGSVNVSGSIRISQGDDLITHHVQAAAVNGVEIQNNTGNVVAQFGAGGGLGTTFNGQINGTAFSGSGALVYGVVSSSFANSSTSASLAQNALTASFLLGTVASASFAISASRAISAESVTSASYAFTASSAETSFSSVSSSYALTASFALNGGGGAAFPFTGSAEISGSLGVTGSVNVSSALEASIVKAASYLAVNTIYDYSGGTIILEPASRTIAKTLLEVTGSFVVTGSAQITGSLGVTGSVNFSNNVVASEFYANSAIYTNTIYDRSVGTVTMSPGNGTIFTTLLDAKQNVVVTGSANFKEIITGSITGNAETATSASYALSASFLIGGGSSAITIADEGTSQGTATFLDFTGAGVTATVSSNTASINIAGGGGSAFPFTGSAVITGSLELTGSFLIQSGSILMLTSNAANNRGIRAMVTESVAARSNIIGLTLAGSTSTGSFIVSGSNNFVSLTSGGTNTTYNLGAAFGFAGSNSILTVLPLVTGSNGAANQRYLPSISNSSVNAQITVNDRRVGETGAPLSIATCNIQGAFTLTTNTGSYSIGTTAILGTPTIDHTGSILEAAVGSMSQNIIFGSTHNIKHVVSGSSTLRTSIIGGDSNRILISGSGATSQLPEAAILGSNLIFTGSYAGTIGTTGNLIAGRFNNPIGNLGDSRQTVVAIGTGTGAAARRTSFHVSASGLTTISDGLVLSGSFSITGSQTITGSLYGSPVSQSVASSTASLNLQAGNFFNLTLPASANTYITASGQLPGQTINLKITQGATTGSVSFGAGIKQVSGSAYTVTAVASAVDIVTFISFDETGLYLSNVKNLV